MTIAIEDFTMVFQRISDDDLNDGEEKDIVGAGSIAEPETIPEKKFGGDSEDSLDPDAVSLEDEVGKELEDADEDEPDDAM
jgi:hypothetical protein